jgi:ketosteroid isomerase-like protein
MKRFLYICILLLICHFSFSQTDSLQKQINEQVWKPFIKAINSGDNDALSVVHSKDVARVMQDDNRIIGHAEYFKKIPDSIKAKWKDWKSEIDLRFLQRIASPDKAFEVGSRLL